jgi:hypothetical protein
MQHGTRRPVQFEITQTTADACRRGSSMPNRTPRTSRAQVVCTSHRIWVPAGTRLGSLLGRQRSEGCCQQSGPTHPRGQERS